ncbi:hypothetical protein B7R74_22130 [Yersinia pseudotuberculosis]|nr:hypothetical protein B7R74_22130 [Yersinia pseudotuberculosis]
MKKSLFSLLLLIPFSSSVLGDNKMPLVKHILYFNIYNSLCMTYANDVETFYNYYNKGPLTSGVNITPFLVNGKNSLSVEVAGLGALEGDETYPADAKCELTITAATSKGETEVAKIIATADEKDQPTGLTSPDYLGKKGGFPVIEAPVKGSITYKITRDFTVQGLPDWVWSKAVPFEPTIENMAKLRQAYTELAQLILNKDKVGIQRITQISFSEQEAAEGVKPGSWYDSLDFDKFLPQVFSVDPIKWESFDLVSVNDGRLVKLEHKGNPPTGFLDKEGKYVFSYAPYFSLINGKIVLTR